MFTPTDRSLSKRVSVNDSINLKYTLWTADLHCFRTLHIITFISDHTDNCLIFLHCSSRKLSLLDTLHFPNSHMFKFCAVNIYSGICILAPWNNHHHSLLHIHVQAVLLYNTISRLYDFSSFSRHASVHCLSVKVIPLVDIFQLNACIS
jgi:hypothetical protein